MGNRTPDHLNGVIVTRRDATIFVPLPRESWRSCGKCVCSHCNGSEGFWDTIAICAERKPGHNDTTWTVHAPELHGLR